MGLSASSLTSKRCSFRLALRAPRARCPSRPSPARATGLPAPARSRQRLTAWSRRCGSANERRGWPRHGLPVQSRVRRGSTRLGGITALSRPSSCGVRWRKPRSAKGGPIARAPLRIEISVQRASPRPPAGDWRGSRPDASWPRRSSPDLGASISGLGIICLSLRIYIRGSTLGPGVSTSWQLL